MEVKELREKIFSAIGNHYTTIYSDEWFWEDSFRITINYGRITVDFKPRKEPFIIPSKYKEFEDALKRIPELKLVHVYKRSIKGKNRPSWINYDTYRINSITFDSKVYIHI